MRNLKLELDALAVESFDTLPDAPRRGGTVHGFYTGAYPDECTRFQDTCQYIRTDFEYTCAQRDTCGQGSCIGGCYGNTEGFDTCGCWDTVTTCPTDGPMDSGCNYTCGDQATCGAAAC